MTLPPSPPPYAPPGDLFDAADALLPTPCTPFTPSVLLEVLQPPVTFHRVFVDLTQSILAALMLSQAIALSEARADSRGWFACSAGQWQADTGLSPFEQHAARRVLMHLGLLSEVKPLDGTWPRYRVNSERLLVLLAEHAAQSRRYARA